MGRLKQYLRDARQAVLALLVIALVPAALEASGIGFRNDTPNAIYVQGSVMVNGQIKRGPLLYVKPGQTVWDVNLPSGSRTITIYNATNQKLLQEVRQFQGKDMSFSVVSVAVPRGQPPRVELKSIPVTSGK